MSVAGGAQVHSVDDDAAAVVGLESVEGTQKRALSRSAGSDDHQHLPAAHPVGHALDGIDGAAARQVESLGDVFDLYDVLTVLHGTASPNSPPRSPHRRHHSQRRHNRLMLSDGQKVVRHVPGSD